MVVFVLLRRVSCVSLQWRSYVAQLARMSSPTRLHRETVRTTAVSRYSLLGVFERSR